MDKFRQFLSSIPLSRNSLVIIGLFVVLAAIPLTVFLTQQQQEIRQRAQETACWVNGGNVDPESADRGCEQYGAGWTCNINDGGPNGDGCVPPGTTACWVDGGYRDRDSADNGCKNTHGEGSSCSPTDSGPYENGCTQAQTTASQGICAGTKAPSACAACVLQYKRTDILPFFLDRDWTIDPNRWDAILEEWCKIDPTGCNNVKSGACSAQCQGGTPAEQTQQDCILREKRTDILCHFQAQWWGPGGPGPNKVNRSKILPPTISGSAWQSILDEWCGPNYDPAACNALKAGACSMVTPPPPTATPVPTSAPTPTSPPGGTTLQFSFRLQSITAPGNPKRPIRQVKVEIFDTTNKKISIPNDGAIKANLQADSIFRGVVDLGGGFTSGAYVVKIKVDNTLKKLIENVTNITAGSQNIVTTEVELASGDIAEPINKLDAVDYANIVGCLDIRKGTPQYSCPGQNPVLTDLNDNGRVDAQDLGILIFNFSNRTGD